MLSKKSKRILVVSDMHVGSGTSVCSEGPVITELGTTYKPNKLQVALNEAWHNCIDELTGKPDLLVVNGEPCDGANKKQSGQQTWTSNLQDQINDAEKLLTNAEYFDIIFNSDKGNHPKLIKAYLGKKISLETLVIFEKLLHYRKRFDKEIT